MHRKRGRLTVPGAKQLLGVPHLAGTLVLYEVGCHPTIGEYASAVYVHGPCRGDLMSLGSGGILPWGCR